MDIFNRLFTFLWSLLDTVAITISGYHFSLGGAIIFAVIVFVFGYFVRWLFFCD